MKISEASKHESTATRWSLRVTAWLIALAFVPLVGASWFALVELRSISDNRSLASEITQATSELIQITELNAQLLDERNWVSASAALDELGLTEALVETMLGVDIGRELAQTIESVDVLVKELDFEALQPQLDLARAVEEKALLDVGLEYAELATTIERQVTASLDEILTIAGNTTEASSLVNALRVLEAANGASRAITIQFTAFYGAQFGGDDSADQFQTLIREQALYDAAILDVRRITPTGSRAQAALAAIDSTPGAVQFSSSILDLINSPPTAPTGDVSGVLASLPAVLSSFGDGADAVDAHLAVVKAAHDDIVVANQVIQDASGDAAAQALTRVAVLVIASLLFAGGLARAIGRPLRDLATGAQHLRDGQSATRLRASGPREVRAAILALNEAAGHIELAGRQAEALADGQLDSPLLDETAPGSLGESLQYAVQTLASSLSERETLALQLRHEATHDGLTQLPNRANSLQHIRDQLASLPDTDHKVAVTFLDLDDFKLVNDHHGHPTGDEVLAVLGRRLAEHANASDLVGRIGGDEFVVISTGPTDTHALIERAQTWLSVVAAPIKVGQLVVRLSSSAGIALAGDGMEAEAEDLLREADLAVYKAKQRRGTGAIEVCDDDLRAEQNRRSAVESALRSAIDHDLENDPNGSNELQLHFQPVVEARTGRVNSAEALLRWESDSLGFIGPAEFIPIAERGNLIFEIDRLVMRKACRQLEEWSKDPDFADLSISINVSAGHIANHSFVDDVLDAVGSTDVDPKRIIIEVTESALLDDLGGAAGKLARIRAHGIRVAIDDFGTGYTSLGQLRQLPVDILKIDRSFVADTSATGLVELIISMGHLLGAVIIAEGIETPEEAERLTSLGADNLQGYLFSRPVPAGEFAHARNALLALAPTAVR